MKHSRGFKLGGHGNGVVFRGYTAKRIAVICFLWFLSCSKLWAGEHASSVFEGVIQVGGVVIQGQSLVSPTDKNKTVVSLGQNKKTAEESTFALLLDLTWNVNERSKIYFKTPFEDGVGLALGGIRQTRFGVIDVQGYYGLDTDVWTDPYVLGVSRTETDLRSWGGGLSWKRVMGTPITIDYTLRVKDVKNDLIGDTVSDLKRDGVVHSVGLSQGFPLAAGLVVPKISYERGQYNGKANAYDGMSLSGVYMKASRHIMLMVGLEGGTRIHAKEDPIFEKDRQDAYYGLMANVNWLGPFSLKRGFLGMILAIQTSDSNINFYDEDAAILGIMAGYRFGGRR